MRWNASGSGVEGVPAKFFEDDSCAFGGVQFSEVDVNVVRSNGTI